MQIALAMTSFLIISGCVGVLCYMVGYSRGVEAGYYVGVEESVEHFGKLFSQVVRTWLREDFFGKEEDNDA